MSPVEKNIAERFEECVRTLERLPGGQPLGYAKYWPERPVKPSRSDGRSRLQATPEQITRMEETLTWITWVNHGERNLIWLRAYRTPWRAIARETGFPKTSAQRYWQNALNKIADILKT